MLLQAPMFGLGLAVAFTRLPILLARREVVRWKGAVFLGYYAAFTLYLVPTCRYVPASC